VTQGPTFRPIPSQPSRAISITRPPHRQGACVIGLTRLSVDTGLTVTTINVRIPAAAITCLAPSQIQMMPRASTARHECTCFICFIHLALESCFEHLYAKPQYRHYRTIIESPLLGCFYTRHARSTMNEIRNPRMNGLPSKLGEERNTVINGLLANCRARPQIILKCRASDLSNDDKSRPSSHQMGAQASNARRKRARDIKHRQSDVTPPRHQWCAVLP